MSAQQSLRLKACCCKQPIGVSDSTKQAKYETLARASVGNDMRPSSNHAVIGTSANYVPSICMSSFHHMQNSIHLDGNSNQQPPFQFAGLGTLSCGLLS